VDRWNVFDKRSYLQFVVDPNDGGGVIAATLSIDSRGSVSSVKVHGKFAGSEVGSCVAQKLKALIFPSGGGSFQVRYTLQ